jgi:hypothetical protein
MPAFGSPVLPTTHHFGLIVLRDLVALASHNITVSDTSFIRARNRSRAVTDHPAIAVTSGHNRLVNKQRTIATSNIGIASNHLKQANKARVASYNVIVSD